MHSTPVDIAESIREIATDAMVQSAVFEDVAPSNLRGQSICHMEVSKMQT
jgi:hypothetical protein